VKKIERSNGHLANAYGRSIKEIQGTRSGKIFVWREKKKLNVVYASCRQLL
jgi:hypothetical protein